MIVVALVAAALALQGGCGYGLQLGAMAGEKVMGAGSAEDADAAATQVPLPPVPDPARPIPPGALYGNTVLVRMRAVQGRKQKRLWKDEFADKKVAGQGRVLSSEVKDLFGALRVVVDLDLDRDGGVDVTINLLNPDLAQTSGLHEGATVWYEGTLKVYDDHIMVAGDWVEFAF